MEYKPDQTKKLEVKTTNIPGLLIINLPVYGDSRGWFKENWQREKMVALGLPDFEPVQNNISYNEQKGATRGLHAEPWDKFISVASGGVFAFWVDLREGNKPEKFGIKLDPSIAVFVPRGVANGYQALEDDTTYTYLVNDHWSAGLRYPSLNLTEVEDLLPIKLDQAEVSDKDKNNPKLEDAEKLPILKTFITGGNGQLGIALREYFPDAEYVDLDTFDICNPESYKKVNWSEYDTIINAAAYTNVDGAETAEGQQSAWAANAYALGHIARVARKNKLTVVHISSDYVFDGSITPHTENESFSPLSVYGTTKAIGDLAISGLGKHYILRTSWVVGEGKNFLKTMAELSVKGVRPNVVNDQVGRLTFAKDLADAIHYLLENKPKYGAYNMTNEGEAVSWADIAKMVFESMGEEPSNVTGVSTAEYYKGKENIAPRPLNSELDLSKIKSVGYNPRFMKQAFEEYMEKLKKEMK